MVILAVDYGDARTGLAVCDAGEMLASPAGVIRQWNREKTAEEVAAAARSHGAERIVVGHPLNMDGSAGPRAQLCREFAGELETRTGLPVVLWDERGTTVTAARYLNATDTRGKKRKAVIDTVAAVIILESYLGWRKNHPEG
jgi:putative Holliday junction resolvase